jgi:hypothetical protein
MAFCRTWNMIIGGILHLIEYTDKAWFVWNELIIIACFKVKLSANIYTIGKNCQRAEMRWILRNLFS